VAFLIGLRLKVQSRIEIGHYDPNAKHDRIRLVRYDSTNGRGLRGEEAYREKNATAIRWKLSEAITLQPSRMLKKSITAGLSSE
jgi:hypothetical protein